MKLALFFLLLGAAMSVPAEVVVRDDTGASVRLNAPARRIVSLAPDITETLFAAGAGNYVVGAVDYSDFPEAAQHVPRVGSHAALDLETIVALKPDLAVAWVSGNPQAHVAKIRTLGIPVFLSQPEHIEHVAANLERYGELAGTQVVAQAAAAHFRNRLANLRASYSAQRKVRTFYQIWQQPLATVGGGQVISDVMRLCGGENVFGHLQALAPKVTIEAVLAANPEVIIASGMDVARPEWLDDWRRWPKLSAVQRDNLFFIPPDLIQRFTPRIAAGAEQLCQHLETARGRLR